ncbi:ChbG/HpnK family deacetylase [Neorhizobium sp. P12A]|uniref:ChbG/HpnK family deacetylase n=1 Tax=Neorhizobium sp. P12A TaxID=2268027 RepID=UPI0011ED4DB6|nr:ChbG/HpnK family deacetylase [Neorhizobium sp. P12A]KAA0689154.1 ChbG/HpnK family deacetylase [Neorhizobium sp. P12A]
MNGRNVNIIADDYGLSPTVDSAIRMLMGCEAIDGTSCITVFPEWMAQANLLRQQASRSKSQIGLHLTLTDFRPASGRGDEEPMPKLRRLLISNLSSTLHCEDIKAELDAQLERFIEGIGKLPDFIDGHQHVHFLPIVRRWLEMRVDRLRHDNRLPWLRGAPSIAFASGTRTKTKVAVVRMLANGFDRQMTAAGYVVRGPLVGFYNWAKPNKFSDVLQLVENKSPKGAVLMCHPGWVDETLISRDTMVTARPYEFEQLMRRM